tara:strand:+ start:43 stop:1056 length:1014 start_codon:yes stop_codon:yes gene_type:complete
MAIFRGGVKIFGSDVRLGITRDRSLDNILRDPRFRRVEGGERPENFDLRSTKPALINQMLSYIMQGEGLGRSGRFYASFRLPKGSEGPLSGIYAGAEEKRGFSTEEINTQIQGQDGRRVNAFCKGITIPDRTMTTVPVITGPGAPRHFVTDHTYGDLSATFFADKYLRERLYFELWQKSAFNSISNNYEFYDNYVSDIDLFNLGQFSNSDGTQEEPKERDDVTHGIKLYDCYPSSIGAPALSYENNNIIEFTVTFKYRYWQNYFITKTADVALGDGGFDKTIASEPGRLKAGGGLIGGLLSILPPELRRAGQGLLGDLKRRIPIGDLTGGRVFPPFF